MKHIIHTIVFSLAFLTLFSACKNPEIDYNTFTITAIDVKPASHNVNISGSYDFSGEVAGMTLNIGLDEQLADAESHPMNIEGQSFSANVNNLDAGTQYYYCFVVEFGDRHKLLTEVSEFTTLKTSPLVRTLEVSAINNSMLQVKSIVDDDGGSDITERGVCWNLTGNPNYTDSHVTHQENDIGEYSCQINGLEHNTTYYVRAYAKNEKGFGLGNVISFTTGTLPTVETLEVTDITDTTAICSGTVVAEGTSPVTERGICWSTEPNSTIEGIHANGGAGIGSFSVEIIDLTPNTTYYVRAYATNSIGTVYGREVNFTTSQLSNYTIAVSASPTSGGTVTGGGTYQQGQNCTVHAKANSNYSFTNWTENGNEVSTNANYTFTVNENRSLVANFVVHSYTINVSASPSNGGIVSGGGIHYYGQSCSVYATANSGYTFTNWTEGNTVVSSSANYNFIVTGNRTLVANFTSNSGSHAYVDLGLPSGLLWATCNVGADNPEDYGDYFAWGETQPKDTYNWSTYQYCNGSYNTLTKYCNNSSYGDNGFTDNLTTLLPEDDAATANWGSDWRMPTKGEWQELYNNTTVTWTQQNGVNGRLFTASNGNSLFMPAAGYLDYHGHGGAGSYGYYWSSSLFTGNPYVAWRFDFHSGNYDMSSYHRYYGQSVRAVRSAQ